MWLLDTTDANPPLKQFVDSDLESDLGTKRPRHDYAILSHRWEDEGEVDFDEIRSCLSSRTGPGWYKIDKCRQHAKDEGLSFCWVDTCCIDKRSSAELQESVNCMYRWYQQATVCYVYLRDVEKGNFEETFEDSEWWTRGWTLQELIAPANVKFYDRKWQYLGDKIYLSSTISRITGIETDILEGKKSPQACSIAQRMSWASRRVTTRTEDRAYSLLGLFDVNMPMIYGEGRKAFLRLQEEIIRSSDDQTIFAWSGVRSGLPGLLAPTPECFLNSGDIENVWLRKGRQPYTMNNRGLSMTFYLTPYCTDTYLATLSCVRTSSKRWLMGVFLRRVLEDDQYIRVSVFGQDLLDNALESAYYYSALSNAASINIRQRRLPLSDYLYHDDRLYGFRLNEELLERDANGKELFRVIGDWDATARTVVLPIGTQNCGKVGVLDISKQNRRIKLIKFGFDKQFNPCIFLGEAQAIEQKNHLNDDNMDDSRDKAFDKRGSDDASAYWSSTSVTVDKTKLTAGTAAGRAGMWALKGDRITGLDVYLMDHFDRNNTIRGHVQLKRGYHEGCMVWDIHIDGLQDTVGKRLRNVVVATKRNRTSQAKVLEES